MESTPEKFRTDLEIIRETAAQVIRDFSIHKVEVVFSGNELLAYTELVAQIEPALMEMYRTNRLGFQALLYQIDIPEPAFKRLLKESNSDDFAHQLAELIIQREFQKVLTRRFFKK